MSIRSSFSLLKGLITIAFIAALSIIIYNGIDKITDLDTASVFQNQTSGNATVILERVSSVWELATTKYYYSNVITFKQSKKLNNIDIPFTQKSFIIKYDGYIKAGIDTKDLTVLSADNSTIRVKMSKAKILDHVIDEKSVLVYDEKDSLLNNVSINDVFGEITKEKENLESKFIEKGLLDSAEKSAKLFLENFLRSAGYKSVEIVF